jgi:hypothetical protein
VIPVSREIAFTTLLKLLQLEAGPRKSELKRLLGGGGYPYWRPLQNLAPEAIAAGSDLNVLKLKISAACSGHQEQYNTNGIAKLHKWAQERLCVLAEPVPEISAKFGISGLTVRLHPDIAFELNGNLMAMALWATTKPTLSDQVLSIGLLFMKQAYAVKGHTKHHFLIFDTIRDRVFNEFDILSSTLDLLKLKHDAIRKDLEELSKNQPVPESSDDSINEKIPGVPIV